MPVRSSKALLSPGRGNGSLCELILYQEVTAFGEVSIGSLYRLNGTAHDGFN